MKHLPNQQNTLCFGLLSRKGRYIYITNCKPEIRQQILVAADVINVFIFYLVIQWLNCAVKLSLNVGFIFQVLFFFFFFSSSFFNARRTSRRSFPSH